VKWSVAASADHGDLPLVSRSRRSGIRRAGLSPHPQPEPSGSQVSCPAIKAIDVYTLLRNSRNRVFSLAVARSFDSFGKGSHLALPIQVEGAERIAIGSEVFIGPGSWLVAGEPEARLEIGDGTAVSGYCVLSAVVHVRVGRNVLFGRNVHVADHRHGVQLPCVPVRQQPLEDRRPVSIEDGSWLGQNVVVLPGVTVGAGAVVGANSVLREDIPPHAVAVGAPARVIRMLG
jgi:acetyltransferase-like isoleucine patch superfamily enzyme